MKIKWHIVYYRSKINNFYANAEIIAIKQIDDDQKCCKLMIIQNAKALQKVQ